jgi:hypothetical protein
MRPQKAMLARGMYVILAVRVRVVIAMMSGPPERPFLIRHAPDESKDELKDAVCFIRTMREVAVITSRYRKDAKTIECDTRCHGNPANAHPKEQQTARVQNGKLGYRQIIQSSRS